MLQLKAKNVQTITTKCCLQETHLRNKDMEYIKVKVYNFNY